MFLNKMRWKNSIHTSNTDKIYKVLLLKFFMNDIYVWKNNHKKTSTLYKRTEIHAKVYEIKMK